MKELKKTLSILGMFILVATVWGCVEPSTTSLVTATAEAKTAKSDAVVSTNPYENQVVKLTTLECAQCHTSVFDTIRDQGGKHQLECQFCHETFHTYRPGKDWKQEVPDCTNCHGEIHGAAFLDCLSCHGNAHAPMAGLTNMTTLEKDCANCHTAQKTEITTFPSAHGMISCSDCHHTQHGNIPTCVECHEVPHTEFVDNTGCMGCHPVHRPTQISYSDDTPNDSCQGCHEEITNTLVNTTKKHATLECAFCHTQTHGHIQQCNECHGQPHSQAMLSKFNGCLECHGDPHALVFPGE